MSNNEEDRSLEESWWGAQISSVLDTDIVRDPHKAEKIAAALAIEEQKRRGGQLNNDEPS